MSQRKDTGLNTNPWPKLVDHYTPNSIVPDKRYKLSLCPIAALNLVKMSRAVLQLTL
jgi:hypothetical protein